MKKPIVLVILDGFGCVESSKYNAIAQAHTPHLDLWQQHYPYTTLQAAGKFVGLPDGCIGNSEVGHMTIGAGRVIKQPLTIINDAIADGSIYHNTMLADFFKYLAKNKRALHLCGLLSDAGVHSEIQHLFAFLRAAKMHSITSVYIHLFLDGRDIPPQSAEHYLQQLQEFIHRENIGIIATLHGRFFAMDRDHNWDRTQRSYEMLTQPQSIIFNSWHEVITYYYSQGVTDEFIPPTQLIHEGIIKSGDGILCYNFRPDRIRQLIACFVAPQTVPFLKDSNGTYLVATAVSYADYLPTRSLFSLPQVKNTFKEVLSKHGKKVFSIAETEKYAHITYFFNGENEETLPHETRILIPSKKIPLYTTIPCMSASEITTALCDALATNSYDVYVVNYANADMVGHSGDFAATVKAVECLDRELALLYDAVVVQGNGTLYITADHGKAEIMFDEQSMQPRTAHTTNPVPFMVINKKYYNIPTCLPLDQLADIAPYILEQMSIEIPNEMRKN